MTPTHRAAAAPACFWWAIPVFQFGLWNPVVAVMMVRQFLSSRNFLWIAEFGVLNSFRSILLHFCLGTLVHLRRNYLHLDPRRQLLGILQFQCNELRGTGSVGVGVNKDHFGADWCLGARVKHPKLQLFIGLRSLHPQKSERGLNWQAHFDPKRAVVDHDDGRLLRIDDGPLLDGNLLDNAANAADQTLALDLGF